MLRRFLFSLLLAGLTISKSSAQITQQSVGAAAHFQGYSFDRSLGVTAANLFMLPVAYELPIGSKLSIDFYSAYARGSVEVADTVYQLNGLVDTRVRANWAATPWAMITVGLNLPTGDAKHDSQEAVVSNVLATEVLGFREASWGLGFGATTGVVTAHSFGGLGVGVGVSYRVGSEFEPSADSALKYTPGNEARVRLALDGNIGANKLTVGLTWQNYSRDKLDGRDLFQPGQRWRADAAYSFRTGAAATWTLYLADVWRQHGDVRIELIDPANNIARDSTFSTGQQNVLVAGVSGAVRFSPRFSIRPSADLRLLTREETGGEGWVAGVGADVPLRWGSVDVFPAGKFFFGQLQAADPEKHSAVGGELSVSLRWGPGS
jgi:hypothetical protein